MSGQWKVGEIITDKSYPYQQLRAAVDAECLRAITCGKWIIATADGPTSKERDDNARLIASAPRMYDWMKRMAPSWDNEAREIIAQIEERI